MKLTAPLYYSYNNIVIDKQSFSYIFLVDTMNWIKFVSYKGQYMLDLSVDRLPYPSALACLHICASISCEHVNYRHFDNVCELGRIKGTQSMVFFSMEGATYYRPATDSELV